MWAKSDHIKRFTHVSLRSFLKYFITRLVEQLYSSRLIRLKSATFWVGRLPWQIQEIWNKLHQSFLKRQFRKSRTFFKFFSHGKMIKFFGTACLKSNRCNWHLFNARSCIEISCQDVLDVKLAVTFDQNVLILFCEAREGFLIPTECDTDLDSWLEMTFLSQFWPLS